MKLSLCGHFIFEMFMFLRVLFNAVGSMDFRDVDIISSIGQGHFGLLLIDSLGWLRVILSGRGFKDVRWQAFHEFIFT